jgi:hypothetical protein
MPRVDQEPKPISSQGEMENSKEGFVRAFVQRFSSVGGEAGRAEMSEEKKKVQMRGLMSILDGMWLA